MILAIDIKILFLIIALILLAILFTYYTISEIIYSSKPMFKSSYKITKFISLLQEVLNEIEIEKNNEISIWTLSLLDGVIKPEIEELLKYAIKGKVYFKHGKKQTLLESTYFICDSLEPLGSTVLGQKILSLQSFYKYL